MTLTAEQLKFYAKNHLRQNLTTTSRYHKSHIINSKVILFDCCHCISSKLIQPFI